MDEKNDSKGTNALVQIAVNEARRKNAPRYDKGKFESAVEYALMLTTDHDRFYPLIEKAFFSTRGSSSCSYPTLKGRRQTARLSESTQA